MNTSAPSPSVPRLASIDAYRGFVMFLILAQVMRVNQVATRVPESAVWQFLGFHQTHVPWIGGSLHDMIQPSFSFLVGVALPFSIAARLATGQSRFRLTLHALYRALILVLLGVALRSTGAPMTNWTFDDTLTQIGLGYGVLFMLGLQSVRVQWIAFAVILVGYWAAFVGHPLPPANSDYASVGVPKDWPHLMSGFEAHWNKNSNLAWAFDTWFMNLFPRVKAFAYSAGGYATLSFIPTLGTMILGAIAGGVLRSDRQPWAKVRWFAIAGVIALVAGLLVGWSGICPVVKRIWTPSWVLYSGGWCLLFMAGFYAVIDIWQRRTWAFPLIVLGSNSIVAYCISSVSMGFFTGFFRTHFGPQVFGVFGPHYETFLVGGAAVGAVWLLLLWMHRRKIFVKI